MEALPPATPWRWLIRHPYLVVGVVTLAALSVYFVGRKDYEWENVFLKAATHLRAGQDVYQPEDAYLYPPFMAWASLPFLNLPEPLRRPVWLVVNLISLLAVLRCSWLLAGGPPLQDGRAARFEHWAVLAGLLCGGCHLLNCWSHLQTDIVIVALQAVGCLLLLRGRGLAAGGLFGLAAACKCTPLLWAPYLAWRRRPLAAALVLVVALGVNLLPDLMSRSPSGGIWLGDFVGRYLVPLTDRQHYAGSWGSEIIYNQSIAGAGQRWLATSLQWSPTDCTVVQHFDRVSPLLLRGVVDAACLLVLGISLLVCGRPWQRLTGQDRVAGDVPRPALEYSVIVLLMLLLSPMSSKAHFGLLVLPGFCLGRAARSRPWVLGPLLVGASALALLGNKDLLGNRLYTVSLWCGSTTWETLFLLTGCWVALATLGNRAQAAGKVVPARAA